MPTGGSPRWYYSTRYSTEASCPHCKGVVRHERWCVTRNQNTRYAFEAVEDANNLSAEDRLILHALGVAWIGCVSADKKSERQFGGILPQ